MNNVLSPLLFLLKNILAILPSIICKESFCQIKISYKKIIAVYLIYKMIRGDVMASHSKFISILFIASFMVATVWMFVSPKMYILKS